MAVRQLCRNVFGDCCDGGPESKGRNVEKSNEGQSGEWIETFAGGPENPIRWMPGRMQVDGVAVIEDARGDVWWQPDGSSWVRDERLKDRHPDDIDDWKKRNPGKGP